MKKLTTVIPIYNGERFLASTLESLAAQSRQPDRLVVLDDCSTDRTRQIVHAFKSISCEFRRNQKRLGMIGNFNQCLNFASQTQYLHILHADDVLKPDFYHRSVTQLESATGRSMIFCRAELIDEKGEILRQRTNFGSSSRRILPSRNFIASQNMLPKFYCPCVLLKTAELASPCRFLEDLPQVGDQVFWADWASHCQTIMSLPEILCQYRVHSHSVTSANQASIKAWVTDEWRAMQRIALILGETGVRHRLRMQMLKCLFAARSQMKVKWMQAASPEQAERIRQATCEIVSPIHWAAGGMALWIRDVLMPERRFPLGRSPS